MNGLGRGGALLDSTGNPYRVLKLCFTAHLGSETSSFPPAVIRGGPIVIPLTTLTTSYNHIRLILLVGAWHLHIPHLGPLPKLTATPAVEPEVSIRVSQQPQNPLRNLHTVSTPLTSNCRLESTVHPTCLRALLPLFLAGHPPRWSRSTSQCSSSSTIPASCWRER